MTDAEQRRRVADEARDEEKAMTRDKPIYSPCNHVSAPVIRETLYATGQTTTRCGRCGVLLFADQPPAETEEKAMSELCKCVVEPTGAIDTTLCPIHPQAWGQELQYVCNPSQPTVPRVAGRLSDLKVGQWLAYHKAGIGWVTEVMPEAWMDVEWDFTGGRVVILSDPPPEPVTVPKELIDRLAEAVEHPDLRLRVTARAVVEAVRGRDTP